MSKHIYDTPELSSLRLVEDTITIPNIYQPYTYWLYFVPFEKWYYGCRYANNSNNVAHPNEFWINYHTSSETVKYYRNCGFFDDATDWMFMVDQLFDTGEEAEDYETEVLTYHNARKNIRFLNGSNGEVGKNMGQAKKEARKDRVRELELKYKIKIYCEKDCPNTYTFFKAFIRNNLEIIPDNWKIVENIQGKNSIRVGVSFAIADMGFRTDLVNQYSIIKENGKLVWADQHTVLSLKSSENRRKEREAWVAFYGKPYVEIFTKTGQPVPTHTIFQRMKGRQWVCDEWLDYSHGWQRFYWECAVNIPEEWIGGKGVVISPIDDTKPIGKDNYKVKQRIPEDQLPRKPKYCKHCDRWFDPGNFAQSHGNKCKKIKSSGRVVELPTNH